MSLFNETPNCLICKKESEVTVSLDEILEECESFTVAQVLENLHLLTVPNLEKLDRVLCYICVGKLKFCFDFKTQCYQIEIKLETESALRGSSELPPLPPPNNITPNTIPNEEALEDNNVNDFDTKMKNTLTHSSEMVPQEKSILPLKKEQSFTRPNDTASNQIIRPGYKSHVCDVCNKAFILSIDLVRHKRTHSGERPFVCDVCNKSFNHFGGLKKHKMIHEATKFIRL